MKWQQQSRAALIKDAPEPCRRRLRVAPQRTRWRSWSTTSTRSTSTRTPPRCASSQPRRASRRRRRRNGLSSAWLSGGRQKACPRNADLSRTRQLGTCRVLRELHLSLLASA